MIDVHNIKSLQWQPNNIQPPYKDGIMTIFFKKRVQIKGFMKYEMRVKCDLDTYNKKYNELYNKLSKH